MVSDSQIENQFSSMRQTNEYKDARNALLNDIVPPEDYNPKTSKFIHPPNLHSLSLPNLLLLLLPVLLLHLLWEDQRRDEADFRKEVWEVAELEQQNGPKVIERSQSNDQALCPSTRSHS